MKAHFNRYRTTLFMEDQVILHWTQWPFAARCSQSARVQVDISKGVPEIAVPRAAPAGSTSPISLYIVPQVATATSPWLKHVGWTTWRDKQLQNHTVSSLRAMVAVPKPLSRWAAGELLADHCIQHISARIRARGVKMLEDANTWLGNSEIRNAITLG